VFVDGNLPHFDWNNKWKTSLEAHYRNLFLATNSNLPLGILDKMKEVVMKDILSTLESSLNRESNYMAIQQVMVLYGYWECSDENNKGRKVMKMNGVSASEYGTPANSGKHIIYIY
jgi:hypothetical protein